MRGAGAALSNSKYKPDPGGRGQEFTPAELPGTRGRVKYFDPAINTGGNSPPAVVYYAHLATAATLPENRRR